MKTDELIGMLAANGAVVAERLQPGAWQRFAMALGWGAFAATLLMAVLLGVRDDLREAALLPMFWVKLAFPLAVAAGALVASRRLGTPGMALGRVGMALAAPVLVMWALAAVTLATAGAGEREALLFGVSWQDCMLYVTLLALPVLVAAFWALRGLAPTQPALAGGAAGLLAGATGAAIYALHCPELAAPFLGVWYLCGMIIPAVAGAICGRALLRW